MCNYFLKVRECPLPIPALVHPLPLFTSIQELYSYVRSGERRRITAFSYAKGRREQGKQWELEPPSPFTAGVRQQLPPPGDQRKDCTAQ